MGLFDRKNSGADRNDQNEQPKEKEGIKYPFLTILVEDDISLATTEVAERNLSRDRNSLF